VQLDEGCFWAVLQGNKEVFITGDGMRTVFERRPFLAQFLARAAQLFELVVFTAGSQVRQPPHCRHETVSSICECL
jgi:TFIIF-interacting CTD phosphatase-like protein